LDAPVGTWPASYANGGHTHAPLLMAADCPPRAGKLAYAMRIGCCLQSLALGNPALRKVAMVA